MSEVTVGVDIGTTSVKALAVDAEGSVLASARVPHPLRAAPGRLEHDADAAWRTGVCEAYARVAAERRVRAVAVSAMVPSLTAVDGAGRPIAPGLLYGDARGGGAPGADPASAGEAAGFLRWLAAEAPDAAGFWPAQAVANRALGGRAALDFATAWCTNPLFDGRGWSAEVLATAGARPEQMPDVVAGDGPVGRVGDGPDGPLIGPGSVDALAAQHVAGADRAGDVLVILGATLIVWAVVPGWVERPGLWTVPHTVPGLCMVGGASNAGGLFVDWAGRLLGDPPDPAPTSGSPSASGCSHVSGSAGSSDSAGPSSDLPVWLPYLRGERTPLHDRGARAELSGLHIGHGPAELRRATYEASGFVARRIIERAHAPAEPAGSPGATGEPISQRPGQTVERAHALAEPAGSPGATGEPISLPPGRDVERPYTPAAGAEPTEPSGSLVADAGLRPRRIVAVGGGVRAKGWVQALADCTGLDVDVAAVPDASALGAAFLARCTAGLESEPAAARRWARTASTVAPDPAWREACDQRYQRFLARTTAVERGDTT